MRSSKEDFIAEAEDLLEEAGSLLVEIQEALGTGINPDKINALFRAIHTIKGISGIFGIQSIVDFSHVFESLLDDIRLGKMELSDDVMKFLFSNVDIFKNIIKDINNDVSHDVTEYLKCIESFRVSEKAKGAASDKAEDFLNRIPRTVIKVLSEYEEHRLKINIKEGKGIYFASAAFSLTDFDRPLNDLTELIRSQAELISMLPTSADLPPDSIGFNILFGSLKPLNELKQALNISIDEFIEPKPAQPPEEGPPITGPEETPLKSASTSVRVDIGKLDRILNTISDLSLAWTATSRIAAEMKGEYGHAPLVFDVIKISQTLGRRVSEIQEQVLEIRMIPIAQIFSRLGQVIKRYSREAGKQIDLLLYGEETEIDKYLAEEIVDPLMHIVRNSIDHGIERPEERASAGKGEKGTITIRAFQRGNHVVIEVKDDGAGIDIRDIKEKAIEKGLIPSDAGLSDDEILDLIFLPGFSTRATVSKVSGRGVGLDVVKQRLLSLGGFVDVATEKGVGTTFFLTMPVTLAILKALTVKVSSERFAIPLTSISETLIIEHRDMQTIEGKEVYNLRGEMLPIVSIAKRFGLESNATSRSFTVVVGHGAKRLGLLVDEFIGQHEIIIKSLGNYLKGYRGFAGAAEIGKHEVILVIDVESIIGDFVSKGSRVTSDV